MNELMRQKRERFRQIFWDLFFSRLEEDEPEPIILPDDIIEE